MDTSASVVEAIAMFREIVYHCVLLMRICSVRVERQSCLLHYGMLRIWVYGLRTPEVSHRDPKQAIVRIRGTAGTGRINS